MAVAGTAKILGLALQQRQILIAVVLDRSTEAISADLAAVIDASDALIQACECLLGRPADTTADVGEAPAD